MAFELFQQAPFSLFRSPESRMEQVRQSILQTLGAQEQTMPMAGPLRPGEERPDITALQEGTGLVPQPVAEILARLMSNPMTQQVGQELLGQSVLPQQVDPTNVQRNLMAAGLQPGTPEFQQAMLQILMKPQVSISQGEKILGNDAKNWVNPATNEKALPTMTIAEATTKGFMPATTEEQKSIQAGKESAPILSRLADTAFGRGNEKSLFPSDELGPLERSISGVSAFFDDISQSDQRIVNYNTTKEAFVTQLARLAGQTGVLTDRDVGLVRGLFPRPGFTPERIARSQFKQITSFLLSKGVPESKLKELGLPGWTFENAGDSVALPPGFVED